jgi:hypothetical protein
MWELTHEYDVVRLPPLRDLVVEVFEQLIPGKGPVSI